MSVDVPVTNDFGMNASKFKHAKYGESEGPSSFVLSLSKFADEHPHLLGFVAFGVLLLGGFAIYVDKISSDQKGANEC